jgi:hypothetical protein
MTYEYQILGGMLRNHEKLERALNEHAAQGWRVVAVNDARIVMERESKAGA